MERKNRIFFYFTLLITTGILSFLMMLLFVYVFNSREKGIAWGLCSGLFFGNFTSLLLFKLKLKFILINSILYAMILFLSLYISSNYLAVRFNDQTIPLFGFAIISIIISFELSHLVSKKIIT
jgi:hypothetical protein